MKTWIIVYTLWFCSPCDCTQTNNNDCEVWSSVERTETLNTVELDRFRDNQTSNIIINSIKEHETNR